MSTEIIVNNDIVTINVTEETCIIEAPSGAYPLPTGVYSVYGRTGNVVAQDGDYTLTLLGDVTITTPSTGQVLRYNGTAWVNSTETYVGTVTSVNMSVPTGLTISGNPVTTAGTLAVGLGAGYVIPTQAALDAKQDDLNGTGIVKSTAGVISYLTDNTANWDAAYNDKINSAAVTGTTTKTLTLNQQDGGTITATWSDLQPVTSVFGRTGDVIAQSGDYNTLQVTENTNLYFTDQRARFAISGNSASGVVYQNTTGVIALDDIPNTSLLNPSVSLNGYTLSLGGSLSLTTTDIAEGTNLYYTDARARAAISGTAPISVTAGVVSISQSGPTTNGYLSSADWNTFNAKQTALTIGNLTSSDISVTGGTGAVIGSGTSMTLATVNSNVGEYGDSVTVPTFTVNAKGLVTAASETAIPTSSASVTGLLSSSDWSTFNNKQAALSGTGFVKSTAGVISYDTNTYLTTIEGIVAGGELSGTYASPSLVNNAVTGKVLTGVNITGGSISATDSILTAFGKVQNQINGLIGGSIYQGTWNASTNTPSLTSGVGVKGYYYIVSVAGSTNLDGITDWNVGDWVIYDGTAWQQVDNTDAVVSVNGFTGAVSLTTSNINEGTNLYYTDVRARNSISAGTGITYSSITGVVTNAAPDQVVSLTGSGTTSISGTYPSFTISSADQYVGTVTSIGITESSAALTITGSPVTTSGNINIAFAGNNTQYVAGDGSLITFPAATTEAENLIAEVYNNTGATLTKGTIVYINGGQGNLPTVTKAIASGDFTSASTFGIIQTDLTNMNNGFVIVFGSLYDLDTQLYAAGTQLYLSGTVAGTWTNVKPYAPLHLVYVGVVTRSHPTQGVVEVRIQNGYELEELHNVSAQSPSNGDILQYVSATSLWTKTAGTTTNIAEGTNLYYTNTRSRAAISLTTTGSSGASTYDNLTGILNVPTYTLAGLGGINLTSLSATSPLLYNNTTGVFSIQQSSGSQAGFLSAADWTTFNNKASTAQLANYLPLTGGTLTGALNGTSATFSGAITGNGNIDINNTSPTYVMTKTGTGANQWYTYSPDGNYIIRDVTNSINAFILTKATGAATFSNKVQINAPTGTAGSGAIALSIRDVSNQAYGFDFNLEGVATGDLYLMRTNNNVQSTVLQIARSTGAATFSSSVTATQGIFNAPSSTQENIIVKSANTGFSKIVIDALTSASSQLAFLENGSQKGVVGYRPSTGNIFLANATGDVLHITSTGNVGINTNNPNRTLTVSGQFACVGGQAAIYTAARDSTSDYAFYASNSTVIYIFNSSVGNMGQFATATGVYTALSDINKKKDFEASTIGLKEVLQLKPTLYRMKSEDESASKELGFIAQEVKEFIPQAYVESGEEDDKFIGLNFNAIVAALTKAVQEQQVQIEELNAKIEELRKV